MTTTLGFDVKEVGTVLEIRKIIAKIKGLPSCSYGQPLTFPGGGTGMVVGFDKTGVMALLFEELENLKAGDPVVTRPGSLRVPVGDGFLGRIVDGLGRPADGGAVVRSTESRPVFGEAPGITERAKLMRPIHTGTKILDSMIPIAKGQRELIIGDRVTGKTTLAVDAILNQKGKDVVCIYCCIGRSYNFLLKLVQLFEKKGAMEYTTVISSGADAPVGEQFLSPYTAASIGEYFMRKGRDVLVVFDDLTKHAWIYRQISLLLDRPPGREAYPGDIFYIHSQLAERAAQLSAGYGGGSMTFLPIVETQQGDVTGYIPTNLISMTDGQIYLSSELFQEGFKPAIDLGLSVSRIGNKIQNPLMRKLCGMMRLEYIQYKELLNVTKLRAVISKEAQQKLKSGHVLSEVLTQDKNEPVDAPEEILLFYAFRNGFIDSLPPKLIKEFKTRLYGFVLDRRPDLIKRLVGSLEHISAAEEDWGEVIAEYLAVCGTEGRTDE